MQVGSLCRGSKGSWQGSATFSGQGIARQWVRHMQLQLNCAMFQSHDAQSCASVP
jgi:hypothetical protein